MEIETVLDLPGLLVLEGKLYLKAGMGAQKPLWTFQ